MGYLDLIDSVLRDGAESLGGGFRETLRGWMEGLQRPDGGFAGRRGETDLYYTDFALRALDLIAPDSAALAKTAHRMPWEAQRPRDLIECFSLLSCARTLSRHRLEVPLDRAAIRRVVQRDSLPEGGFAAPATGRISAYRSFLGALCLQLLGDSAPSAQTIEAVSDLQRASGGFAERHSEQLAQTNSTCAVLGLLLNADALDPDDGARAVEFLGAMQGGDGGLRAHAHAACSDLLSTFTGLLTLCLLGAHTELDLPGLARFVRGCARPGGGFSATPADEQADLEYTYYAIGSMALMLALLGAEE